MPRLSDYECPPRCEGRSVHCHETCGRHAKYRELAEERRERRQQDLLTIHYQMEKKIKKTENRFR